ncbi:uncharacterized protein LOC135399881 [Ornithodoros turicata]|uniref:uncharacterized protein LOC135399881 n=1 Tax=Ornithodoros turicata TaxID=34597 RepID=UPI003139106D
MAVIATTVVSESDQRNLYLSSEQTTFYGSSLPGSDDTPGGTVYAEDVYNTRGAQRASTEWSPQTHSPNQDARDSFGFQGAAPGTRQGDWRPSGERVPQGDSKSRAADDEYRSDHHPPQHSHQQASSDDWKMGQWDRQASPRDGTADRPLVRPRSEVRHVSSAYWRPPADDSTDVVQRDDKSVTGGDACRNIGSGTSIVDYDFVDLEGTRQFRKEVRDAYGVVRGCYGYTKSDGTFRVVEYVADDCGFRTGIRTNEHGVGPQAPADVVLVAEPPPAAVLARIPVAWPPSDESHRVRTPSTQGPFVSRGGFRTRGYGNPSQQSSW